MEEQILEKINLISNLKKEDIKFQTKVKKKKDQFIRSIFLNMKMDELYNLNVFCIQSTKWILNPKINDENIVKLRSYFNSSKPASYETIHYDPRLEILKKPIEGFVFERLKKNICFLTDCYKDKRLKRVCELCGKIVEFDHFYCSECGKEVRK